MLLICIFVTLCITNMKKRPTRYKHSFFQPVKPDWKKERKQDIRTMILPLAEMMDEDAKPVRQTTTNSDREHTKSMTKTPSEEDGGGWLRLGEAQWQRA